MPPTIIVTVGRLACRSWNRRRRPVDAAVLLLPDEHAATVSAVAHAAASGRQGASSETDYSGMVLLLDC